MKINKTFIKWIQKKQKLKLKKQGLKLERQKQKG
jgi:hypothetical protein